MRVAGLPVRIGAYACSIQQSESCIMRPSQRSYANRPAEGRMARHLNIASMYAEMTGNMIRDGYDPSYFVRLMRIHTMAANRLRLAIERARITEICG